MTHMPAGSRSAMYGGGGHFAERIAAIGVATAWNGRVRQRKAVQRQAATVTAISSSAGNILNDPQYPQEWDDYIGQEDAKATIQASIKRAKDRGERVRHMLIANGEPGVGKTALAVLTARAIGGRCFIISGTPNYQQVRMIILGTRPGDVLFIDEIHRLVVGGKSKAEWLLHVLENNALVGPTGVERANLGITVIGATTDAARLPDTLLSRFGPPILLERFDVHEAMQIAALAAEKMYAPLPIPTMDECLGVVYAADFNPRKIKSLLSAYLDTHYEAAGPDLERALDRLHLTIDGLDDVQQRYLMVLRKAAGPMGEAQLKSILQEPSLTHTERRLVDKGLVQHTKQGRMLTAAGMERADVLIEENTDDTAV